MAKRQGEGSRFKLGRRLAWLCAFGLALALGALGCGGESGSLVVARVGDSEITESAVAHWARVIATGNRVEAFDTRERGGPRVQALGLLMAATWLRLEALARGVEPSSRAVDRVLAARREANGAEEFEQDLRASGQTTADVRLEIEAELAANAIRRDVISRVPAVTKADVLAYYNAHHSIFRRPEMRIVDLVEGLSSPTAARILVRRIGIGADFSKRALHEEVQLHGDLSARLDSKRVVRAIFAAHVGAPSRPLRLGAHWTVFVVREVVPAKDEPLRRVRSRIAARIVADRRRQALAAFSRAHHDARWAALVGAAVEPSP